MIITWIYETVLAWFGKDPKDIAFDAVAGAKRATLDQVEGWVGSNREEAQDSFAALAKGEHVPGYDQITNVAQTALAGRNAAKEAK